MSEEAKKRDAIGQALQQPGSPFQWRAHQLKMAVRNDFLAEILADALENETLDGYSRFCLSFVIAIEYFENDELAEAESSLAACTKLLTEPMDRLLEEYRHPLVNTLTYSYAFLAYKRGDVVQSESFVEHLTSLDEFSPKLQSAVWATKGSVLQEYGVEGWEEAIKAFQKAVELRPEEARWHLLLGWEEAIKAFQKAVELRPEEARWHLLLGWEEAIKAFQKAVELRPEEARWHLLLGRCMARKWESYSYLVPSKAEIQHLQKAAQLESTAQTAVYLAQTYRQAARANKMNGDKRLIQYLNNYALKYYRQAIELNCDKDEKLTEICVRGIMSLPKHMVDESKLPHVLQKTQSSKHENTHVPASKSKPVYVGYELRRIYNLVMSDPSFDPVPAYEILIDKLVDISLKRQIVHLEAATYILIVKKDVAFALGHFMKALELNPENYLLRDFHVKWFKKPHSTDIIKLMECEVLTALNKKKCSSLKEEHYLRKALLMMWSARNVPRTNKGSSARCRSPSATASTSLDELTFGPPPGVEEDDADSVDITIELISKYDSENNRKAPESVDGKTNPVVVSRDQENAIVESGSKSSVEELAPAESTKLSGNEDPPCWSGKDTTEDAPDGEVTIPAKAFVALLDLIKNDSLPLANSPLTMAQVVKLGKKK